MNKSNPNISEEKLSHFINTYSFSYCNTVDMNIHKTYLDLYFNKFKSNEKLTFFDVGCNAGSFIEAAKYFNKNINIHCFEPHPVLCKFIRKKYPDVICNECCLFNEVKKGHIYIPSQSVLISSIINRPVFDILKTKPGADGTIQKVYKYNTTYNTIDNYCKINNIDNIDYLKVDTEGAEYFILEGGKEMFKNGKIKAGQLEGHAGGSCLKDAGVTYDMLESFLKNNNYEIIRKYKYDIFFYLKND